MSPLFPKPIPHGLQSVALRRGILGAHRKHVERTLLFIGASLSLVIFGLSPQPHFSATGPLSKDQVLYLLNNCVSSKVVARIVRQRKIDFQLTAEVESDLRQAGATDELLSALREVAPKWGKIWVTTAPDARVYLDDDLKGQANAQGALVIENVSPGAHKLRASLTGERQPEQQVMVSPGQATATEVRVGVLASGGLAGDPGGGKGELSGAIARTHDELVALAHKVDRDYFDIDLRRKNERQEVGKVTVELEGTDTERSVFSVNIDFDGKRHEHKHRAVNTPVYFYVQGASSALELVVTTLGKDSISGFLITPRGFFSPAIPQRVRVGGGEASARLIFRSQPDYPQQAKIARVQGMVKLQAIIDKDGTIQQLNLMSGHPLLVKAAMDAVWRWRYKPMLIGTHQVEVITEIDVSFALPL